MSRAWDIGCKTCDVAAHVFDINHGDEALAALIQQREGIAAAAEAFRAIATHDWILGLEGEKIRQVADFFAAHVGHELRPRDEYGVWLADCQEWFKCPTCAHPQPCRLPEKHSGEHSQPRARGSR